MILVFKLGDDFILLQADARMPPVKIGYLNRAGWIAYLRLGVLFVKRFTPQPALPHTDFGCNTESYCNDAFIELETVGPLQTLTTGSVVEHIEDWEFISALEYPLTDVGVRRLVADMDL